MALKVDKQGRLKVSEADIERTCTELLELDGWRSFKMEENFSERKMKRTGEKGMPDRLYLRYNWAYEFRVTYRRVIADVLWIEWKANGGKPSLAQRNWIAAETKRGAMVLLAGTNFPASIEGFKEWYRNSGLMRNRL